MAGRTESIYELFRNGYDKFPQFIQSQRLYHPGQHLEFLYGKKICGKHQDTIIIIEACVFFPSTADQVVQIKPRFLKDEK
jgi:hypothetical protein